MPRPEPGPEPGPESVSDSRPDAKAPPTPDANANPDAGSLLVFAGPWFEPSMSEPVYRGEVRGDSDIVSCRGGVPRLMRGEFRDPLADAEPDADDASEKLVSASLGIDPETTST